MKVTSELSTLYFFLEQKNHICIVLPCVNLFYQFAFDGKIQVYL